MRSFIQCFLCVMLSFTYMHAQGNPNFTNAYCGPKKLSIGQLYGIYKIALGGALILTGAQSMYTGSHISTNLFNNHKCDLATVFTGAHVIYSGVRDILKKPNNNLFFKIHKKCIDSVVLLQSSLLVENLFSLLKIKIS